MSAVNVEKAYGNFMALRNLTIKAKENVVALVGPNGSGKSTFLKILVGLIKNYTGEVSVLGFNPKMDDVRYKRRIGVVLEDHRVEKWMKVGDYLELACLARESCSSFMESELFNIFNIKKFLKKKMGELSAGMFQKVVVFQAFLGSPNVIFLDEPFKNLDYESVNVLRDFIKKEKVNRKFFLVSHNLNVLLEIAEEVFFIREGKIVDYVSNTLGGIVERVLIKSDNIDELNHKLGEMGYKATKISAEVCVVEIGKGEYNELVSALYKLISDSKVSIKEITKIGGEQIVK
ncbi:MAG: ATP-binding cassette domain-containing protein [Candidatus Njordarchaeia archaeon]